MVLFTFVRPIHGRTDLAAALPVSGYLQPFGTRPDEISNICKI